MILMVTVFLLFNYTSGVTADAVAPFGKSAAWGEGVMTRCGLLEENIVRATEGVAVGQNVAVSMPTGGIGQCPSLRQRLGLQVVGQAFLLAAGSRDAADVAAHDAPAVAFTHFRPGQGEVLTVVLEDVVRFAVVVVGIADHLEGIADALRLAVAIVEPQTAIAADKAGIAHAVPPAI